MEFDDITSVIFDNDGVIVNSEPLSCEALRQTIKSEFNVDIGTDYSPVIGTSDDYAFSYYLEKHDLTTEEPIEKLIDKKHELYFKMASGNLSVFDGFYDLIDLLRKQNYKLAVASSGSEEKIRFSLEQVRVLQYFEVICSAEMVANGKPEPDLFELTARKIGTAPSSIVVIEDSTKGIEGANKAGMKTIGFTSSFSANSLLASGADLVINSFDELIDLISD